MTIKDGENIENGRIIAFGSVVMRDVPDFHVVAGTPARIVSKRLAISDLIERSLQVPHTFAKNLREKLHWLKSTSLWNSASHCDSFCDKENGV